MTTVEELFRKDLKNLLEKYHAEISAEDHYSGYSECGQDIRITATIDSEWDHEGNQIRPFVEIDLGRYFP